MKSTKKNNNAMLGKRHDKDVIIPFHCFFFHHIPYVLHSKALANGYGAFLLFQFYLLIFIFFDSSFSLLNFKF